MTALAMLQLAFAGIEGAVRLFNSIRDAARQARVMTPEQDAEFDAKLAAMFASDAWKTDAQLAAEGRPRVPVVTDGQVVPDEPA